MERRHSIIVCEQLPLARINERSSRSFSDGAVLVSLCCGDSRPDTWQKLHLAGGGAGLIFALEFDEHIIHGLKTHIATNELTRRLWIAGSTAAGFRTLGSSSAENVRICLKNLDSA